MSAGDQKSGGDKPEDVWPEVQRAECLARGAALKWASGVFCRPEHLERLSQYRKRESQRTSSIHTRLKSSEHNRSLDDLDEDENHVLPALEEPQTDVHGAPRGIRCGGEDGESGGAMSQRQTEADRPDSSLVRRGRGSHGGSGSLMPMYGGEDGDGDRWGGAVPPGGSLNEQIVVALARLQEDMQSVLQRLQILEALTASQARSMSLPPTYASTLGKKSQKPSWWPFDISPTSLAFAVIWPFVVQWLIRLYLQRRRRRIN